MTVNDFMDTMMSDPGPPCLVWLPLLHRLASVETGKLCSVLNIICLFAFYVLLFIQKEVFESSK